MPVRLAMALTFVVAGGALAQVTNNEAMGNLAPRVDPGCVTVVGADPRLSPPDLALGVLACGREGKWEEAADLYALMLLRAFFDTARVEDVTAHQASDVLTLEISDAMSEADRASLGDALAAYGDPAGPKKLAICEAAKASGAPQHDPAWMVQHGMGAFLGTEGDGLVKDFNPVEAWERILREDMRCG